MPQSIADYASFFLHFELFVAQFFDTLSPLIIIYSAALLLKNLPLFSSF